MKGAMVVEAGSTKSLSRIREWKTSQSRNRERKWWILFLLKTKTQTGLEAKVGQGVEVQIERRELKNQDLPEV
jgi:hypothetical protein